MASIRAIKVGNVKYLQVIDYLKDIFGNKKVKVIKSFGQDTPENRMEAEAFLANYNMAKKIKEQNPNMDREKMLNTALKVGGGVLGAYLGWELLKWLFDDKEKK